MPDVLRTVHRIRKVEERRARAQLCEAEAARSETERALTATETAMHASWERAQQGQVIDLWAHHTESLRMEMRRRAQVRDLDARDAAAGAAHTALRHAAVDAKVVELVADTRDEQLTADLARRAQSTLDEQGLIGWWRRSA